MEGKRETRDEQTSICCPFCQVDHPNRVVPTLDYTKAEILKSNAEERKNPTLNQLMNRKDSDASPRIICEEVKKQGEVFEVIIDSISRMSGFYSHVFKGRMKKSTNDHDEEYKPILVKIYKIPFKKNTDKAHDDRFHQEIFFMSLINSDPLLNPSSTRLFPQPISSNSSKSLHESNVDGSTHPTTSANITTQLYGYGSLSCGRLFLVISDDGISLSDIMSGSKQSSTVEKAEQTSVIDGDNTKKRKHSSETSEEPDKESVSKNSDGQSTIDLKQIATLVLLVLKRCHTVLGIGHLDIKLSNITFNSRTNTYTIIDWNSANFLSDDTSLSEKRDRAKAETDLVGLGKVLLRLYFDLPTGTINANDTERMLNQMKSPWKEVTRTLIQYSVLKDIYSVVQGLIKQ